MIYYVRYDVMAVQWSWLTVRV